MSFCLSVCLCVCDKNFVVSVVSELCPEFHEFPGISSRATHATKFLSHTDRHTDRQTSSTVKSCSDHPKMCKSIKNRKSKIFTKPTLSSIYITLNLDLKLQHASINEYPLNL